MQRRSFSISGQVQGVGFRPFVFRLAERFGLTGSVRNGPEGVLLEVQGAQEALAGFASALTAELPPLARISSLQERELPLIEGEESFQIVASSGGLAHGVLISPDVATCEDCLADMREEGGRRQRYPFTNCTNCGPRYTITRNMPYDRAQTSMSCFPLCPECGREYTDPRNRRFHAQPNACPVCGPQVWLVDSKVAGAVPSAQKLKDSSVEEKIPSMQKFEEVQSAEKIPFAASLPENCLCGDEALKELAERLLKGEIAAVKGLGGFHLVCDATNDAAVQRLREAKQRPHKPFAVMAANLEDAHAFVQIGPDEERLLTSLERPIVLCPARPESRLSALISPDTHFIGVMLPYTPLHHLLLQDVSGLASSRVQGGTRLPVAVVMTSGNRGGEPIALGNREALEHLAGIVDIFLLHNRDILIRTDDSVLRPIPSSLLQSGDAPVMHLRRARGFVPAPLALPKAVEQRGAGEQDRAQKIVLGLGAELKNTICLSRGAEAFVSQHIGDLQNLETSAFQVEIARHLSGVLQVQPQGLVLDAHPDFANQSAVETSEWIGLPRKTLQHHFAHAEAVLAENRESGPALVLALDGTGYAPSELNSDKSIWGGELIYAHPAENRLERIGSLGLLPLPGGEAAICQPWRIAHGALYRLGLLPQPPESGSVDAMPRFSSQLSTTEAEASQPCSPAQSQATDIYACLPWLPEQAQTASLIPQMIERGLNTPWSSSAGRLFDAVAALLGLCLETTYEGQAAIRLEEAQYENGLLPGDYQALYAEFSGRNEFVPQVLDEAHINSFDGASAAGDNMCADASVLFRLDTLSLIRTIYEELRAGQSVPYLARYFHWALAEGLADLALAGSQASGASGIGLSGGVMQNMSMLLLLKEKLRARGLNPLTHHRLPPNDGCISYGQVVWGTRNL